MIGYRIPISISCPLSPALLFALAWRSMCFFLPASGGILFDGLLFLSRANALQRARSSLSGQGWLAGHQAIGPSVIVRVTPVRILADTHGCISSQTLFDVFHGLHNTCCFCNIYFFFIVRFWIIFHPSPFLLWYAFLSL